MEMQQALEDRMRILLEHASQAKVAEALGVTRTTVHRWAHGMAVTPGAVTRVQALLRPDLNSSPYPSTTEEAPPPWAEGLESRLTYEIRANREAIASQLAQIVGQAVAAALAELPPQPRGGSVPQTPRVSARRR